MPALAPADLTAAMRWRYAVKKFDPTRTVPPETWAALEDALVQSPSSFGLQPWKFFVVTDKAVKESLVQYSWGQRQVADCSHLVVFGLKLGVGPADADRLIARTAAVTGAPADALKGYRDVMANYMAARPQAEVDEWSRRQVYIAHGVFLTACALLGVDACPMEGFSAPDYDRVLGLTAQGYTAAVVAPAGYRAADDKQAARPKVRYPAAEVVGHV